MIDRKKRDKIAEELRHYLAGITFSWDFETNVTVGKSKDKIVSKMIDLAWGMVDHPNNYRKFDASDLTEKDWKTMYRFILFLKSNAEYKWPAAPINEPLIRLLSNLLTLGYLTKHLDKQFESNGNIEYWPFLNENDFEAAKAKPVYLKGT